MSTAEKIRLKRKELGLTQVEFALLIGVHPVTVGKWETGVSQIQPWFAILSDMLCAPKSISVRQTLAEQGAHRTLAVCLCEWGMRTMEAVMGKAGR